MWLTSDIEVGMALGAPRELRGHSGDELGPVTTGSLQQEVQFTPLRRGARGGVRFLQCLGTGLWPRRAGFQSPLLADCVTVNRFLSSLAPSVFLRDTGRASLSVPSS